MVKKVFSYLLAIAMIATSITIPVYAEKSAGKVSVYEPSANETLLMNLGIIDKAGYDGNDTMTRGDFAVLLANTLGLEPNEQDESSSELPNVDDSEIISPVSSIFKDVDVSSEEYGAIMSVYANGYMVGVSEDLFAPEYGIVLSDAIKVFVDMLGFSEQAEVQGGYPLGYEKLAASFNLYKGVSCGFYDVATKKDIASLLCNVMETPIAKIDSFDERGIVYKTSSDETFMTELMSINKTTGVITDNGLTAIDGPSALSQDEILCNGIVMNLAPEKGYVRKYLGRKVNAYYSINDEDERELVFAEPKDDVTVIAKQNFISYDDGVLKYQTESSSIKSVNIGVHTNVIYNGVYTSTYTEDIFDLSDGYITLIKNDKEYTVVINDYKNVLVSKTEADDLKIYNRIIINDPKYSINQVSLEDYEEVSLLDSDGESISFSSIKEGDVLSIMLSPDYKYAEVILCTDQLSGIKFKSISAEKYVTETDVYDDLDILKKAVNAENVRLNKYYTLYFSTFGTLVWIAETKADSNSLSEGILLRFLEPQDEENYKFGVKIYSSNGLIKTFYVEKKFKLNLSTKKAEDAYFIDDSGNEAGLLYDLDVVGKPILYKEEDSIIKEMITPLGYTEEDDKRGWYQITYDYLEDENKDQGIKHIDVGNGASFGGILSYDKANCNVYAIPHESFGSVWANREKITVNQTEFRNHALYRIEGYSRVKNSTSADVLVYRDKGTSGTPDPRTALLITDVVNALDVDMEECTIFSGYEFTQPGNLAKVTYTVAKDAKIVDTMNNVTSNSYTDLEEGDIIRFSKNVRGEINNITMSYDYSRDEVSNTCCRDEGYTYKGYVMGIDDNGFKIVTPGQITEGETKTNVFYTPDEIEKKILSQTLTPEQVKDCANMIRTYLSGSNYPVVIVDTSVSSLEFKEASLDDVFSYEKTPGRYDTVVVCTHYLGGKMGAIVYR